MRWLPALALVALVAIPAPAAAQAPGILCFGGHCRDGEHHIVDCSPGWCRGNGTWYATLVNPSFGEDWLDPDERVVGVEIAGDARAYPIKVLNWFEVVRDTVGDAPVVVTFCDLCGSAIVWDRRVDNETRDLLNLGATRNNNQIIYDRGTGTWWAQVTGRAFRGPLNGSRLELVSSTVTPWSTWKDTHPDTKLMRRPVDRDGNDMGPYHRVLDTYTDITYTPQPRVVDDDRLHPKAQVLGVEAGGEAIAFPFDVMEQTGFASVELGGTTVVAVWKGGTVHAFEDRGLELSPGPDGTLVDRRGRTHDPLDAPNLTRAQAIPAFWFAWLDSHPDTRLHGPDTGPDGPNPIPGPSAALVALAVALGVLQGRRRL